MEAQSGRDWPHRIFSHTLPCTGATGFLGALAEHLSGALVRFWWGEWGSREGTVLALSKSLSGLQAPRLWLEQAGRGVTDGPPTLAAWASAPDMGGPWWGQRMSQVRGQSGLPPSPQPENILCVNTTGHLVKIIDFGLARRYHLSGGRRGGASL